MASQPEQRVRSSSAGPKRVVAVLGASGDIGSFVTQLLRDDPGMQVRACVRKQEKMASLAAQGLDARLFDYADYDSVVAALTGVDAAFMVLPYTVDMLLWGKNAVDAAKAAGVQHVVKVTTFNEGALVRKVGHFAWHALVDDYLSHRGLGWTLVGGHVFMQNFRGAVHGGELQGFWDPKLKAGLVDTLDVARVCALALSYPSQHGGKRYLLSSEALTGEECAAVAGQVLGRDVKYKQIDMARSQYAASVEETYGRCVRDMIRLAQQGALGPDMATVTPTFREVTGEHPCNFRDFLLRERQQVEAASTPGAVGGLLTRARAGIKGLVHKASPHARHGSGSAGAGGGSGGGNASSLPHGLPPGGSSGEPLPPNAQGAASGINTSPS